MTPRRASALVGLAVAAVALALTGSATAAEDGFHLRPTGGAQFPDRDYVLSLPTDAYLTPSSVVVRENGQIMKGVTVEPASTAQSGQFGVVLVIDASRSMQGSAIDGALAAARAFAAHRVPGQALGIVTFNSTARVLLPLSTDSAAIDRALAEPPALGRQTHIYDAVALAVSMLQGAKVTVRSVVVLSDGADTGSAHSLDAVASTARDAGVRVFSIGLRSRAFNANALGELARQGGGGYSEARTPSDLQPIFDELGSKLASEYLIRYRSPAPPNRRIVVAVTVKGYPGAVTAGYRTPALTPATDRPFNRPLLERFVRSSLGMLITAGLAALLAAAGVILLVHPHKQTLRNRLAEFVSLAEAEQRAAAPKKELPLERAERSFRGTRWWARFKEDLDVARIDTPAIRIVVWTAISTAVAIYLLATFAGPLAGLLGFSVIYAVRAYIRRRVERQRRLFSEQLPDNLQVLASALRAGHSLIGALSVVVDDAPDPSRREFRRLVADEQLGVPLEDSFEVIAERMASTDIRQVGLVAALQHETGGNTAEVLDRVAETVRERFELRRLVRTLTAQGRLTRWILSGLPVFLVVVITLLNPKYISPLFSHPVGRVLLVLAATMVVAGSLVIRRIINIKV
jgi:tight adherence protein B